MKSYLSHQMRVCVGGTFNVFHKGHKLLLSTAIQTAGVQGYVFIGLASGDLVHKKPSLRPLEERENDVEAFIQSFEKKPVIDIQPITTVYGPTLIQDFDAIIVSSETKPVADHINQKRKEKGLKEMEVIIIPYVVAEDGLPIQSSRIITGEINRDGKREENRVDKN